MSTSSETTLFGENTSSFSGSSLSILEQLQSSLKQKEGELSNSQVMVASLERSRTSLTQELATVSERNEVLEQKVKMIPELQQKLKVSNLIRMYMYMYMYISELLEWVIHYTVYIYIKFCAHQLYSHDSILIYI